jgi:predicted nucleic acid-binding protein
MSDAQGARPLFIDTGAFFAAAVDDDKNHARASAVFEAIAAGDLPYRPLYTNRYVLAELATLTLGRVGHAAAVGTLERIRESPTFNVEPVGEATFTSTCKQFAQYDDQEISFFDHITGVMARERDVEHVFTFDPDDFRTLGFTVVPADTGEP